MPVTARETRIAEIITRAPSSFERYLSNPRKKFRRNVWKLISATGGFYTGNMITLAFGTLGVNDVIAGGICVLAVEWVSEAFWGARNPSFNLLLLNFAKCGFTCALMSDAIKLGS